MHFYHCTYSLPESHSPVLHPADLAVLKQLTDFTTAGRIQCKRASRRRRGRWTKRAGRAQEAQAHTPTSASAAACGVPTAPACVTVAKDYADHEEPPPGAPRCSGLPARRRGGGRDLPAQGGGGDGQVWAGAVVWICARHGVVVILFTCAAAAAAIFVELLLSPCSLVQLSSEVFLGH